MSRTIFCGSSSFPVARAGQLSEQRGRYAKEVAQICGQTPGQLARVCLVPRPGERDTRVAIVAQGEKFGQCLSIFGSVSEALRRDDVVERCKCDLNITEQ